VPVPAAATAAAPRPTTSIAPATAPQPTTSTAPAAAPQPTTSTAPAAAPQPTASPPPAPVEAPAPAAPRHQDRTADATAAAAAAIAAAEAALGDEVPEAPGRSGAIAGLLVDAAGAPIPGATILALAPDGTDGTETFTDDDGEFVLPGLRPGRYAVFTGLGTPLATRIGGRSVKVRSTTVTRLDIREPRDAAPIRIAAVDADGRPVEGEAVLIAGPPGENGAFGSLLASDAIYLPELGSQRSDLRVPPGTYTLVVLQGVGMPARAAREPVRVVSSAPLEVSVQLGGPVTQR
jgi:hypothetical protein